MEQLNPITIAFIVLFVLPLATGFLKPFSRYTAQHLIGKLFDNIEFLTAVILSTYLTKKVFFDDSPSCLRIVYTWIPQIIKDFFYGKVILTYILVVPLLMLLILLILRVITWPVYKIVVLPLSKSIHTGMSRMKSVYRRVIGALLQLPKSLWFSVFFALMLNFFSYSFHNPLVSKWLNESRPYQFISQTALNPILNSNIAKRIPVILNDSFRDTFGRVIPTEGEAIARQLGDKIAEELNIKVIQYFNGVTLDEAVLSNEEIALTAKKITKNKDSSKKKAYALYEWISTNIKYDFKKAELISESPSGIDSGAIVAFETRKGICFDFSSLYVAMCQEADLKVRLVTGLAYSGIVWGDHAWNQVYITEEERWINVDTTFGSVSDYFDKPDFDVDHKYAQIQGEW